MAEGSAGRLCRGHATICLPIGEEEYDATVENPKQCRQWLDDCYTKMPELFPEGFVRGYRMKDGRTSVKQDASMRRIILRDGRSYSIRPSFLMPYMTARTEEVEAPLFLRKFGVPFWALARVFGSVDPVYAPKTVNTDRWHSTQAAWKVLFPLIAILQCFLHAWLKIRDRAKHLGESFFDVSERVWDTYHAPDRRGFSQRIRSLRSWAGGCLTGIVRDKVLDLCDKRDLWSIAYDHPGGHRTSNMLDRLMRSMNRYFDDGQHLHGSRAACDQHCRAWALLHNFTPWHPATADNNEGWQSPAEHLNGHRYHDNWLQNLLVSASLGGYRNHAPQNP